MFVNLIKSSKALVTSDLLDHGCTDNHHSDDFQNWKKKVEIDIIMRFVVILITLNLIDIDIHPH